MEDFLIQIVDEGERREYDKRARVRALLGKLSAARSNVDAFADTGPRQMPPRQPTVGNPAISHNTESYDHFGDNPFLSPVREQLSTFSVDVDTASYSNVRRMIGNGSRVPVDATRIEEFINYFPYDYAPPATGDAGEPPAGPPFAARIESASAPWAPAHRLVRIALKGYEIDWKSRPPSNLVFLLDVSGSMTSENKLGLVKESLETLIKRLDERDRISIVVYAGSSGLVLPPTPANRTKKILNPPGLEGEMLKAISPLKYQKTEPVEISSDAAGEMLTLKLRYKEPTGTKSKLITVPFTDGGGTFEKATEDFRFAAAVASFGMILRDSDYKADSGTEMIIETARGALGEDRGGFRQEFTELVGKYGANLPQSRRTGER